MRLKDDIQKYENWGISRNGVKTAENDYDVDKWPQITYFKKLLPSHFCSNSDEAFDQIYVEKRDPCKL